MKVIASHNGLKAVEEARRRLAGGEPPLDACIEGVTLVEDDPEELTVGYGGLPNEDGVVELDAAVMDGRTHRGAGVAALRGIRHPSRVARLVMEQTNRVLLVGEGALAFARANGFVEENLLTERARRMWLYWKRTRSEHDDWRPPAAGEADLDVETWFEKHFYGTAAREGSRVDPTQQRGTGTVHVAAQDAKGDMACVTSTSGHAFKIAGRVGDSPILGAGLYVDNEVGSCGSIGHGEANLENCSSFAAVELMRGGLPPVEAGLEVLRRVAARSHADRRDDQGRPTFNLQLFLLAKDGAHAGVAMWGPKQIAVGDEEGVRLEACTALFERSK
ncbi:MAG: N(4)-(beta-N-acetylglucosaminyl)-L-asparaginase [Pirellulaceae bacterium]